MKYTVIYERTVWVRKYETLKMGIHAEYDYEDCPIETAMRETGQVLDKMIINKRSELRTSRAK